MNESIGSDLSQSAGNINSDFEKLLSKIRDAEELSDKLVYIVNIKINELLGSQPKEENELGKISNDENCWTCAGISYMDHILNNCKLALDKIDRL